MVKICKLHFFLGNFMIYLGGSYVTGLLQIYHQLENSIPEKKSFKFSPIPTYISIDTRKMILLRYLRIYDCTFIEHFEGLIFSNIHERTKKKHSFENQFFIINSFLKKYPILIRQTTQDYGRLFEKQHLRPVTMNVI